MSGLHVMHVIDSMHGGGAETSLLEMLRSLSGQGITSSIVTLRPDDGALEERIRMLGLTYIKLRSRNPLRLSLELQRVIATERPDLLHTTLLVASLTGRLVAQMSRTPVITTLANQDYGPEHRGNSRYGAWSVRTVHAADMLTVPLTTHYHAVSTQVANVMSGRLRIRRDRIRVIYRGRDPARLGTPSPQRRERVRTALSIGAQTPVVLSVARIDRQKGVDTTIDAFRRLLARRPDAVLLIAGRPGNATHMIKARTAGCPAIRLLGHRTDVADLMCAADVLSFPSRWEGLGGTLLEAMALRLAIVASDIPPVAEALGQTGWPLVQPGDHEALAEALMSVIDHAAMNEAKKDAGQQRFHASFTVQATSEAMARLYREVLNDSKRRPAPSHWRP